jgi:hypothetical protein
MEEKGVFFLFSDSPIFRCSQSYLYLPLVLTIGFHFLALDMAALSALSDVTVHSRKRSSL